MPLSLGSTTIGEIYLGSTKIGEAYQGSTLVYQSAPALPAYTVQFVFDNPAYPPTEFGTGWKSVAVWTQVSATESYLGGDTTKPQAYVWNYTRANADWSQEFHVSNRPRILVGFKISKANLVDVTSLDELFYGQNNLKEVHLGNLTAIASGNFRLFEGCSSLQSVYIGTLGNANTTYGSSDYIAVDGQDGTFGAALPNVAEISIGDVYIPVMYNSGSGFAGSKIRSFSSGNWYNQESFYGMFYNAGQYANTSPGDELEIRLGDMPEAVNLSQMFMDSAYIHLRMGSCPKVTNLDSMFYGSYSNTAPDIDSTLVTTARYMYNDTHEITSIPDYNFPLCTDISEFADESEKLENAPLLKLASTCNVSRAFYASSSDGLMSTTQSINDIYMYYCALGQWNGNAAQIWSQNHGGQNPYDYFRVAGNHSGIRTDAGHQDALRYFGSGTTSGWPLGVPQDWSGY